MWFATNNSSVHGTHLRWWDWDKAIWHAGYGTPNYQESDQTLCGKFVRPGDGWAVESEASIVVQRGTFCPACMSVWVERDKRHKINRSREQPF